MSILFFMQSHSEIHPRSNRKKPIVLAVQTIGDESVSASQSAISRLAPETKGKRASGAERSGERAHEGNEECTYFRAAHSFSSSSLSTYMIYCSIGRARARARFSLPIVVFMATHSTSITSNLCGKFFSNSGGSSRSSSSTFSLVCT
jgi:hypothetical protein